MNISITILGTFFEIESRLPHALFINAGKYQFGFDRNIGFTLPSGKHRSWIIEKEQPTRSAPVGMKEAA